MRLPDRPKQHVIETASWKLFNNSVPDQWIVRDVTGRDYGIDAYLEICQTEKVTGDLTSIQLKGTDDPLEWKNVDGIETCTFSGTRVETVNLWMLLPVPTFFVVTDNSKKEVYFINAKEQARQRYEELQKQDTFGFYLNRTLRLDAPGGPDKLVDLYFRERKYASFAIALSGRLGLFHEDLEFIYGKQNYGFHMEVEDSEYFRARSLCHSLKLIADVLDFAWPVPDIDSLAAKWRHKVDPDANMHYGALDELLVSIEARYFDLIERARAFVTKDEGQYWFSRDLTLYNHCSNLDPFAYRRNEK